MSVDARAILRRRHLCLVIVRSVALLLALAGAVVSAFVYLSRTGHWTGMQYFVSPLLVVLGAFWIPAVLLAAASRAVARWLVPVPGPASECPQCGYSLKNLKAPICPECGLTLRTIEASAAPPQPHK